MCPMSSVSYNLLSILIEIVNRLGQPFSEDKSIPHKNSLRPLHSRGPLIAGKALQTKVEERTFNFQFGDPHMVVPVEGVILQPV